MNLRLPAHWGNMTCHAKAAYLVDSKQATAYAAACSVLSRRRRVHGRIQLRQADREARARVESTYWWNL